MDLYEHHCTNRKKDELMRVAPRHSPGSARKPFRRIVSAFFLAAALGLGSAFFGTGDSARARATSTKDTTVRHSISLTDAQRIVTESVQHTTRWTGAQSGPPAQPGKTIAYLTDNLDNGGALGVAQGVREAANVIGWTVKIFDGGGTSAGLHRAFEAAAASRPDGVIVSAFDAREKRAELAELARLRVPMVGWHVGAEPGPIPGTPIAMNITTDPLAVARVTAMAAIAQSGGRARVVIFTDSRYDIATAKANAMADIIRACEGCTLLEVRDVPLAESGVLMPKITKELLTRYGKRWTYALSINDLYSDDAMAVLISAGLPSDGLSLLSAGDGSAPAFLRIQAKAFQIGTVAEPLCLQGWQAVDELNRLFAHEPVSGFVAPVHLVTADNIAFDGGPRLVYDPDNGYRDVYQRIWKR